MIVPTKWGNFEGNHETGGGIVVRGRATFGGQDYDIALRLYETALGWMRREFMDLSMTKVGGKEDGEPARPRAREIVLDYLPEQVNSVIGGDYSL